MFPIHLLYPQSVVRLLLPEEIHQEGVSLADEKLCEDRGRGKLTLPLMQESQNLIGLALSAEVPCSTRSGYWLRLTAWPVVIVYILGITSQHAQVKTNSYKISFPSYNQIENIQILFQVWNYVYSRYFWVWYLVAIVRWQEKPWDRNLEVTKSFVQGSNSQVFFDVFKIIPEGSLVKTLQQNCSLTYLWNTVS